MIIPINKAGSTRLKIGQQKIGFYGAKPIPVPGKGYAGPWMFLDVLRFFVQAGFFNAPV